MRKKQFILNLCLVSGIATANAQDGAVNEADLINIGILPNSIPVLDGAEADQAARPVTGEERNPFSERESDAPQVKIQTESEELKIKRLINDMTIHGGLMDRPGGPKVLLGDLILQKGSLVPQVLPDQTEQLVVRELNHEKIELAYLDTPEYKGPPRVITIELDIRPTVGQVLAGGNDDYLVKRGRDEMAAEKQLASVLASRATGGSIGTTIPGIKINGKTAKREKSSSGLSSLLRNYGQPSASGITGGSSPGVNGAVGNGANPSERSDTEAATPFDFGGFEMQPAEGTSQGSANGQSAPPMRTAPQSNSANRPSNQTPPPPSFTN
ncbi:MAG: hypothetical protein ACI9R3_000373 [Verrucomicrobiales bacterium]|jgi:hypothetical protein